MRIKTKLFIIICIIIIGVFFNNVKLFQILYLPEEFYVNYDEIKSVNDKKIFGNFIDTNLEEISINTDNQSSTENSIIFKLFGFIPIKKVSVKILPSEEVYIGGNPIGINVNVDGAVVVSDSLIDVENSLIIKNAILKNGDIILTINNQKINSLDDIDYILENTKNDKINIEFLRNNKTYNQEITLIKDKNNKYKLGVWVKDDFSGIGTLTFIKKDFSYAAFGHPISSDSKNKNIMNIRNGEVYNCSLVGINKGQKNDPGELKCVFVKKDINGTVSLNTKYGIFGKLNENENLVDKNLKLQLGGRLSVKPGKAKIISSVSGIREEYDIEIIKANYQSVSDDKSIFFRVKDERLINLTGGIVQGMSGSPIIQNDKIIGAVTHVFLSDPTKGYGVYTDWMIEQMNF